VVGVNPRGASEGLSYENPHRDWISAHRIKMRGWGGPDSPAEMKPLLVEIPASLIIEAGSPQALAAGSSLKSIRLRVWGGALWETRGSLNHFAFLRLPAVA